MKKITLLLIMFGLSISTTNLTAQVYYSTTMNGGNTYVSKPGSFAGYAWGGIPNYTFDNTTAKTITIEITNFDATNPSVGNTIYINFSRSGFGIAPLGWGSDNLTVLKTLSAADFTNGAATVVISLPTGTLPIAETPGYVQGYNYILQIVGSNPSTDQNYVNYVVGVTETLSTKKTNRNTVAFYPNPATEVVTFNADLETKTYKVLSMSGALVKETAATSSLNVSDLSKGTYIIARDAGSGKLIKE